MTAKSPASQSQMKEFDGVHDSLTDILGQLRDIDPSRLSFSPFLDLDTQISLAPISDSPESSVEELHSTEDEEDEEENVQTLTVVEVPELVTVDHRCGSQISVGQENPGPPEMVEGPRSLVEGTAFQERDKTVAIRMPSETSFLDTLQPLSGSPRTSVVHEDQLEALDLPDRHERQPFLEVKATNPVSHHGLEDSAACSRGEGGITLRAFSVLCLDSLGPLDTRSQTVLLHQMFVAASVDQLAIFCLNLVVTATFLPEEHLRLIPILAGLFSVGRFCYWVTLHLCSTYRGFGFGLSFFPSLSLTAYNLFCLYEMGFGFLFMPAPLGYIHPTPVPTLEGIVPKG